ncbi:uncharacterized protein LOC111624598 [Centruroides sculpturatus]|uniref:uncharacterized protein LOC111624598 n=1 Tax=Centruroides sculpturatus TaxID=218467 RepID=UPI000C6E7D2C|nr:uncharacterized protein LOC111624598 [Centruroides sculpturatus]
MKSFLRIGLMLFLSAEYYFCASEKYENTTSRVIERRMIGGRLAEKGEFPFLVAIYRDRKFSGAFSLITTRTLIGAAHIVQEYTVKDCYGRIGNVNKHAGKKVLFRRMIIHKRYNSETFHNDIALLILARSINNISPIALVGKNVKFTKGSATFVGWGRIGLSKSVIFLYKVKDIYGRIGDVNKNAGKKVLFRRRIIHGRYNPKEYNNNDIALLILAHRINDISPIALVRKDLTFTEGHATLVGWGNIGFKKDDKTDLLQVAEVNLVDPKYVARKFDYELTYKEITTVSSRVIGMKGDSGSPLIKRDALNRPVLIGILSNGGNNTGKPDVYMSTSVHYSFIRTFRVGRPTYLDVKN